MIREPESGILRALQTWTAKQIKAIQELHTENVFVMTEDEGDYESEVEKHVNRHRLCVFVFTPGLDKVDHFHRTGSVTMKCFESPSLRRSHGRVIHWTALRLAEKILATLDGVQMEEAPFAKFFADNTSIRLESQTPWLVYDVNMVGRMILKKVTT